MIRVASLHRPGALSGVSVTAPRLACLPEPAVPWIPLVVGPRGSLAPNHPARGVPGFVSVEWDADADPVTQALEVADALRTHGITVVVPNDLPHGFVAGALLHHRGVRVAAWIHGDDDDADDLFLRCGPLFDAFRGVSQGTCARASRCGVDASHGAAPLWAPVVVPGDPAPFDVAWPRDGALRILYAGVLRKRLKRVMDLAVLASELDKAGLKFELTIAGDGPARDELGRALWDHVRSGRVRMLGAVPLAMMPALHRAHDLTLLVSESEGMPNVVMEAWAMGRATAITDACGEAAHLLTDAREGIVFQVGDVAALARRLATLDRSDLACMGSAAHSLARRHCSLHALAPRFDAFVREAANAPAILPTPAAMRLRWDAMLAALELLGPCHEGALARLKSEWLDGLGVPDPGLSASLPGLPGREARRLLRAIAALRSSRVSRVALYGAGWHTRKLEAVLASIPELVAILDDRAGTPDAPRAIGALPVLPVDASRTLRLDAIVISSDEHERDMAQRAARWCAGTPIVPLYSRAG